LFIFVYFLYIQFLCTFILVPFFSSKSAILSYYD
jgi:hypothetical protein